MNVVKFGYECCPIHLITLVCCEEALMLSSLLGLKSVYTCMVVGIHYIACHFQDHNDKFSMRQYQ